jgi:hypothetical protein
MARKLTSLEWIPQLQKESTMDMQAWSPVLVPLGLAWFAVICLTGVFLWKTRADKDLNGADTRTSSTMASSLPSRQ